jgi:hypothetical protein
MISEAFTRYRVIVKLSEGGVGKVYIWRDVDTRRPSGPVVSDTDSEFRVPQIQT